ncbi:MAG TPA: HAMP domain-containing sensor histidine kinase [Mycobacteriales bacterium]|nr:HAMP domain-containing sensor histidine kinase [Mycobacteriales bacterium]
MSILANDPPRRRRSVRFRDRPLLERLLVPYLVLVLVTGALGTYVVSHDLAVRGQVSVDRELSTLSLQTRSHVHDQELYVVDALTFASHLQGVAEAVEKHDTHAAHDLLRNVAAFRPDASRLALVDRGGRPITVLGPGGAPGATLDAGSLTLLARAVTATDPLLSFTKAGAPTLAVAGPVCAAGTGGATPCRSVGAALAELPVTDLLPIADATGPDRGITIFGSDGNVLASSGPVLEAPRTIPSGDHLVTRHAGSGRAAYDALYAPLVLLDTTVGSVGVRIPTSAVRNAARTDAIDVALVLLGAMAGVVLLGFALSRGVLAQVRPLLRTVRSIGAGDLSSRSAVRGDDELGELARGVNTMAEQLQANVETLESRVAQRTEEVQRLMRQRSQLFAALSHEFRTPLAVVRGAAQLLREDPTVVRKAETRDMIELMHDSAGQVLDLVNAVLDLAATESATVSVDLQPVDVAELVVPLRRTLDGLATSAGLTATVRVPASLPPVLADREKLHEVLLNLLDNAVKYTPSGGAVELRVGTSTADAGGRRVVFRVKDTGVGIPAGTGDQVFEPFVRAPGVVPQHGSPSSGLGLAIAKGLVEAMGGTLTYESVRSGGTVFVCSLPVATRADAPAPTDEAGLDAAAEVRSLTPIT